MNRVQIQRVAKLAGIRQLSSGLILHQGQVVVYQAINIPASGKLITMTREDIGSLTLPTAEHFIQLCYAVDDIVLDDRSLGEQWLLSCRIDRMYINFELQLIADKLRFVDMNTCYAVNSLYNTDGVGWFEAEVMPNCLFPELGQTCLRMQYNASRRIR